MESLGPVNAKNEGWVGRWGGGWGRSVAHTRTVPIWEYQPPRGAPLVFLHVLTKTKRDQKSYFYKANIRIGLENYMRQKQKYHKISM